MPHFFATSLIIFLIPCLSQIVPIVSSPTKYSNTLSAANRNLANPRPRFQNPILRNNWDPNIYLHPDDGFYYWPITNGHSIQLQRSQSLIDWTDQSETRIVFNASAPYDGISFPRIHHIDGIWYIHVSMVLNGESSTKRLYAIRGDDSGDPFGHYSVEPIRLSPPEMNEKGIASDLLIYEGDELYLVWHECPEVEGNRCSLFIAPMKSPTETSAPKVALRNPKSDWEGGYNALPTVLQRGRRTFVIFEANGHFKPESCLGMFWIDYGRHPLVAQNWVHDIDRCVFWKNDDESVFTTCRAVFTTSKDGKEHWMMYTGLEHASDAGNWTILPSIRAEKFVWDTTNFPVFPRPAGLSISHAVPSS